MPYDAKLDESIFTKAYAYEGGKIVVGVFAYNKGQKKLQITRENLSEDGETRFAKLGRMTKDEAANVLPLMQEALGHMG